MNDDESNTQKFWLISKLHSLTYFPFPFLRAGTSFKFFPGGGGGGGTKMSGFFCQHFFLLLEHYKKWRYIIACLTILYGLKLYGWRTALNTYELTELQ